MFCLRPTCFFAVHELISIGSKNGHGLGLKPSQIIFLLDSDMVGNHDAKSTPEIDET